MKYALLDETNTVIQVQPYFEEGFIEVGDSVVCGMVKDGDGFIVPPIPIEIINAAIKEEALLYLAGTDWYVTRFAETGVAIPDDIMKKRQEARDSIV